MEQIFKIKGMSCGGCVASVQRAVAAVSGVERVTVDLPAAQATVQFDGQHTNAAQIRAAIEEAGYDVVA